MVDAPKTSGYSATVRLELRVADCRIPLAQVGPDWVIPRRPHALPPTEAELIVTIDDHVETSTVVLDDGMSAEQPFVPIRPISRASINEAGA